MFVRGALGLVLALGCGATTTNSPQSSSGKRATAEPKESVDPPSEDVAAAPEDEATTLPKGCARKDPCQPPRPWVDHLCQDVRPSMAVYLFQKDQPWDRRYLRGKTEAINASGGATREGWLAFDEEVLVLQMKRADPNGMQVSGASESYYAMRWDGSCVTLSGEEVTATVPPSPKHAFVTWRFLDSNVKDALEESESVKKWHRARRKECKGATMGEVSKACVKADAELSDAIVEYVRSGGKIPVPENLP